MDKRLCAGDRAIAYLAKHPGFENRICYGDLFRALRIPEGTPLQQRLNEKAREQGYDVRVYYEQGEGCIRYAYYWMTHREAQRIQREREKARKVAA